VYAQKWAQPPVLGYYVHKQPPALGYYVHKQINVSQLLCIEIYNKKTDFKDVSGMIKRIKNSVAFSSVQTERPPLVGEVSANFLRIEGVTWSAQRIRTVVNIGFQDRSRYFSIQG
jgi:hypothetical protein